ncbi:MAG: translation initiation factor IF-2 [Anaerovoracaceae bacterium]
MKDKAGKKDYRKKDSRVPFSMEKQTPKKYKKKAEKTVEPESNIDIETLEPGSKVINVPITVKGLSEQIDKTSSEIIMALMKLGIMANVNQNLDEDTAVLLGSELGINIVIDKIEEEVVEEGLETFEDKTADLENRPPIITVMGHVDHGKTSLLDAIRKTNVTSRESGGITQHIGASEVTFNGERIVFLDTPGHEAFTAMRARGAHVTDIAVLVVAADDSVKPQTIESISHAKAAGVPVIVAINKIDKPEANPDRVKQDLANLPADQRILVEEWGGETISVPVSAKSGEGIPNLLEMILLQSEVLELKANPNRLAMGTVVEARLDKTRGPVATLLVLNGTLETGMSVVVGTCSGKIRAMTNFKGEEIRKAGPATAVEILGLNDVPEAGDEFNAVKEDKIAREIAEQRRLKVREEVMVRNSSTTLEELFSQIKEGEVKELNLVIKADVQGSVGALITSLEKLQTENVKVRIIHSGVGAITESDIMLASTSDAVIIGFNVRPSTNITTIADREKVQIRTYRVIYDIINEVEAAMKGMLDPIYKEVVLGKVEIRNTFKVPGAGVVGGAYVLEGKVQRHAEIRLIRDSIVIHEGKISSLRRFKDDAKEVNQGYECGIGIENYNDIKEGDIIEAFKMEEIER